MWGVSNDTPPFSAVFWISWLVLVNRYRLSSGLFRWFKALIIVDEGEL
jgi:hypothetical protein